MRLLSLLLIWLLYQCGGTIFRCPSKYHFSQSYTSSSITFVIMNSNLVVSTKVILIVINTAILLFQKVKIIPNLQLNTVFFLFWFIYFFNFNSSIFQSWINKIFCLLNKQLILLMIFLLTLMIVHAFTDALVDGKRALNVALELYSTHWITIVTGQA